MEVYGKYFYGNEVSPYGQEHGYVDYRTLAKAFDAVLNNEIIRHGYWEQVSGFIDHSEEIDELREQIENLEWKNNTEEEVKRLEDEIYDLEHVEDNREVFQWYIVSSAGVEILEEAGEILYYNDIFDMYLWGVTHYGTSWDYVLTDIRCNTGKV